jgi:phosphoenolpyruvate-protein kinase (PTS system EI component)
VVFIINQSIKWLLLKDGFYVLPDSLSNAVYAWAENVHDGQYWIKQDQNQWQKRDHQKKYHTRNALVLDEIQHEIQHELQHVKKRHFVDPISGTSVWDYSS